MTRKLRKVVFMALSFLRDWELFTKLWTTLIVGSVFLGVVVFWLWHEDGPALVLSYMLLVLIALVGGIALLPEAIGRAKARRKANYDDPELKRGDDTS